MRNLFLILLLLSIVVGCKSKVDEKPSALDHSASKMLSYLESLPLDSLKIPRSLQEDGTLDAVKSRDWTSGFFPGVLWHLYDHSQDEKLKEAAENWTAFIEKEKYDTHTHDLGFKLNCSFGNGYAITGNENYKEVVVTASKTLIERFDPEIGSIRSWDWNADVWQFPVIIDNMMNLEMLFDVTRFTGDSTYHKIAEQHAITTNLNHYRPDNSCFHVVDFDTTTNVFRLKTTHQGLSDESAWSRGQAWGLYGFTVTYDRTKNPIFLDRAKKSAEFIFNHSNLPEDKIPYWDFDAPNIPDEVRDVSAAAVAASALIDLAALVPENRTKYLGWADEILASLSTEKYQSNVSPFLLDHSTGSVPGKFEIDVPIVYGDYYYVEALLKRSKVVL